MITGEPDPVEKSEDDRTSPAATINKTGSFKIGGPEKVGGPDTMLSQIVDMLAKPSRSRPPRSKDWPTAWPPIRARGRGVAVIRLYRLGPSGRSGSFLYLRACVNSVAVSSSPLSVRNSVLRRPILRDGSASGRGVPRACPDPPMPRRSNPRKN